MNDNETVSVATSEELVPVNISTKGDRGIVGEASPGLQVRQLWRDSKTHESLKAFARRIVSPKSEAKPEHKLIVKNWFANKKQTNNAKKSDKNLKRITEERMATKASRKPSKK